ncbi:MAG: hypothetical protein K0R25_149 [Rickettsiaceae bacterium]|jgi:hypothetical protein|nr:hypothetical protein [Rickettsiaceae bacterium]
MNKNSDKTHSKNNEKNEKSKIIEEARRIQQACFYAARGLFVASHHGGKFYFWTGIITGLLSAVASTAAFSQFDYHNIISGIISIIVAGLSAIITFINPNKLAASYHVTGNKYNALETEIRIFYEIEIGKMDEDQALLELKKYNDLKNKIDDEAPPIPRWAIRSALKELKKASVIKNDSVYFVA